MFRPKKIDKWNKSISLNYFQFQFLYAILKFFREIDLHSSSFIWPAVSVNHQCKHKREVNCFGPLIDHYY